MSKGQISTNSTAPELYFNDYVEFYYFNFIDKVESSAARNKKGEIGPLLPSAISYITRATASSFLFYKFRSSELKRKERKEKSFLFLYIIMFSFSFRLYI